MQYMSIVKPMITRFWFDLINEHTYWLEYTE